LVAGSKDSDIKFEIIFGIKIRHISFILITNIFCHTTIKYNVIFFFKNGNYKENNQKNYKRIIGSMLNQELNFL